MEDSILITIKKLLNITDDDTSFDIDIITHINSVFLNVKQLGVGKQDEIFHIEDKTTKWSDFFMPNEDIEAIKSYIALKVKMIFDPPANSSIIEAYKEEIKQYEWRINSEVDF